MNFCWSKALWVEFFKSLSGTIWHGKHSKLWEICFIHSHSLLYFLVVKSLQQSLQRYPPQPASWSKHVVADEFSPRSRYCFEEELEHKIYWPEWWQIQVHILVEYFTGSMLQIMINTIQGGSWGVQGQPPPNHSEQPYPTATIACYSSWWCD